MIELVDPTIGTELTELGEPSALASTWWAPKPRVGNTHPGACSPLGMVSACSYSGAYPAGYGLYDKSTEGAPTLLTDRYEASGFTHFQQSGTGAIRKYYNYVRVTPMLDPLDELGSVWGLEDEQAAPGYYQTTLSNGIHCELTVGPKSAVHRYTFPESSDARIVVDFSQGGLSIDHGRTVPMEANIGSAGPGMASGVVVMEGVPLAAHLEVDDPSWRQLLWYDRRLMPGGSRLEFDAIRETTARPFGVIFRGPTKAAQTVELRIGFSLRGADQARANLHRDCGSSGSAFSRRRRLTQEAWTEVLEKVQVEGGTDEQQVVFSTALYRAFVKPCFAEDESPFWDADGPFVFDIATMWDIYKTQLPLLLAVDQARTTDFLQSLLKVAQHEGNFPIGYRMARGADRFFRQGSALAHPLFADAAAVGLDGIDWELALQHLTADLRRTFGEDYLENGLAHPITHTLDLAQGYHCTAQIAHRVGDLTLAGRLESLAGRWESAFDSTTGLLVDSTFYEGGRWNYSFRLVHDMATRIELAGGDDVFVNLLDQFFGFGADPVKQLGNEPSAEELRRGYDLNRFEGLNNEPDMEAPYSYHYAGRPDRTAEVVTAILTNQFTTGRGGLPGNDDSGGLSSWFVWAALGIFPVAGQGVFLLSTPLFPTATITLGTEQLSIVAERHRPADRLGETQYIQSATFNGEQLNRSYLTIEEVHAGGSLRMTLGDDPLPLRTFHRPPSQAPKT